MQTITEAQQIEEHLLQSIQQYKNMLNCMQDLDERISTALPTVLQEFNETLVELQKAISLNEQVLFTMLSKAQNKTNGILSLLDMREHLITDILLLNKRIQGKATGIKSFIAHEIGRFHTGLSAMNGYRKQQQDQGRIFNRTS